MMKKIMTTAVLTAFAGVLIAPTVLAAPEALTGEGTITYEQDNSTTGPKDPEKPTDPVDPVGPTNPDGGPLAVDYLSNLKFKGTNANGSAAIGTAQGLYYADEVTTKVTGTADDIKRGNWVQVTDKRALGTTGKPAGWTLSATLSKQFTSTNGNVLNGATITYANPFVNTNAEANISNGTIDGVTANNNITLSLNNSAEMVAAADEKGWGTYTVEYGRPAGVAGLDDTTKTSDKSILLTVPANTPLAAETYTAEITWTIAEL